MSYTELPVFPQAEGVGLMVRTEVPHWLLAFWKDVDDETFAAGFDCFASDANCRLGAFTWSGREAIKNGLRNFIANGFATKHYVEEFWDAGALKVFRGTVAMRPRSGDKPPFQVVMTHLFYMTEKHSQIVQEWIGSAGPAQF